MESNEQSQTDSDPENKVIHLFIEIYNLNIFIKDSLGTI
jgi:hypothetical protein